jgi:hypothetical protein
MKTSPQQAAGYQNRIFYLNQASFGELKPYTLKKYPQD